MKDFLTNLPMKYKIAIVAGILIIIVIGFIFLYKYYYVDDEIITNTQENITDDEQKNEEEENVQSSKVGLLKENKKIMVHMIGEVNTPGVVTLEEGSRIIDAINASGGTTEDADLSKINLAYVIEDGVQIYVPRIGEEQNSDVQYINEEAGEGVIIGNATQEKDEQKDIKVNINTATSEKLQTIPGIGAATAQKILDYRKENGNFKTIDDIKNVSGIGDSKFNNMKEYITVK